MQFQILHYDTLSSTNDLAKELSQNGASEGTVVFADYQTNGRGRYERRWQSPKGKDLLFTVVVRPNGLKTNQIPIITQIAAASIRDTIEKVLGIKSSIKKPNDILIEGKKVCGILVEGSTVSARHTTDNLIVGVGINVNSKRRELLKTATSLHEVSGDTYDRGKLLESLLLGFSDSYKELVQGKF